MSSRFLGLIAGCWISSAGFAIELPESFVDEAFVSGLPGQITGFDWAAGDRLFIVEKAGVVRVAVKGILQPEPFLDIHTIVNDRVDRGMLSVAVHPAFPQKPYIYVLYTYDPPELVSSGFTGPGGLDGNGNRVARLVRYTADKNKDYNEALAGSATIIMGKNSTFANIGDPNGKYDTAIPSCGSINNPVRDCLPIDEMSHTIGAVRFAPEGSMFVSNGDGASYHSIEEMTVMVQDLDSMRGKVLRIDPDTGHGLPDNPFFDGDPASNRSKVINFGLRNPYSMTIHPKTGVPYVGDVGWDLWEEIDGGYAKNFAWPCYSGGNGTNLRRPGFEDLQYCQQFFEDAPEIEAPMLSWPRLDAGSAIVGDFYFGEEFPQKYRGKLFYADFLQGWMRYADVDDPDNVTTYDFATEMLPMVEIRVGDDGGLYYASITSGEVRRIRYTENSGQGNNEPPQAVLESSTSAGGAPLTVQFSAAKSVDSDGSIVGYAWNFGDGQSSKESNPSHVFRQTGQFTVSLTVTDNQGADNTAQKIIQVSADAPVISFTKLDGKSAYRVGDKVDLHGVASASNVALGADKLSWKAVYTGVDGDITNYKDGSGGRFSFTYPDHADDQAIRVCLSAVSPVGGEGERCEELPVSTALLELDTYPAGLQLQFNGEAVATPFSTPVLVGGKRLIAASANADSVFARWSDKGPVAREISMPDSGLRLVANYTVADALASYVNAFPVDGVDSCTAATGCWRFFWNPLADVADFANLERLVLRDGYFKPASSESNLYLGTNTSHAGRALADGVKNAEYAIAAYPVATNGQFAISGSSLHDKNASCGDGVALQVLVNDQRRIELDVPKGGSANFDTELGTLKVGDTIRIAVGPKTSTECDTFTWNFGLQRQGSVEVAPEFSALTPTQIVKQKGQKIVVDFSASDANGDPLVWAAKGLPKGLTIDKISGRVSGTLKQSALYASVLSVSDGVDEVTRDVQWEIRNADGTVDKKSSGGSGAAAGILLLLLGLVLSRWCDTNRKSTGPRFS